jgi:hypothetical protein
MAGGTHLLAASIQFDTVREAPCLSEGPMAARPATGHVDSDGSDSDIKFSHVTNQRGDILEEGTPIVR